jgi:hypothetical protein
VASKNGLKKAKEFYQKAIEEFKKAKERKDDILFRDAAEKGWNAVVLATNELFLILGRPKPRSHFDRRKGLLKLEEENGIIKRKAFFDRFMAREQFLHEYCFYEGIYTEKKLELNLKKVKDYIKDVEKVTK